MAGREGQARPRRRSSRKQLDKARGELEQAQRKGEYQRAGELAYGIIPELEKELAAIEAKGGGDGEAAAWWRRR